MLIVYSSLSNGNTRRIAGLMQRANSADIAEFQTVEPYTGSYNDMVDRGYKPAIKPLGVDPSDYQTVAVGTPTR